MAERGGDTLLKPRKYTARIVHPNIRLASEICPRCDYPEAYAGYCNDCGWTRYCGCLYCQRHATRGKEVRSA